MLLEIILKAGNSIMKQSIILEYNNQITIYYA